MTQTGKSLSMHSDSIYKGNYTHNGTLLNIHENSYTIGYSALLTADGTEGGATAFGNAVFYDGSKQNNHVFVGAPTTAGAVPIFAGIIAREPGIASSYPVKNAEIQSFQHGLLVKEGYLIYKRADVVESTSVSRKNVELFNYVYPNWCMFARKSDGSIYFTPKSSIVETTGDILVGRVVSHNPDDHSFTVYVSPAILVDTAIADPTLNATATPAQDSIAVAIDLTVYGRIVATIKEGSAIVDTISQELVYNASNQKYEAKIVFTDLKPDTQYTIDIDASYAGGLKTQQLTDTSAKTTA